MSETAASLPRMLRTTAGVWRDWLRAELTRAAARRAASVEGRRPRVLLLAQAFPPTMNAGVFRPLSWARRAEARGWAMSVVTFEPPADARRVSAWMGERVPASVQVTRLPRTFPPVYWRLGAELAEFVQSARVFFDAALKGERPDVVVATGPVFFPFLAATWLAEHWGVPLVLDYRDEWSQMPNPAFSGMPFAKRLEARCLKRADLVLMTTESQCEAMTRIFPQVNAAKLRFVPNGWDAEEWVDVAAPAPAAAGDERTIAFLGELRDHNGAADLVPAFEQVFRRRPDLARRFRLRLIGWIAPKAAAHIGRSPFRDRISVEGAVDKREALATMVASDVLLMPLDAAYHRYIPGKLYEYVASGRPILTMGVEDGEVTRIVDSLGAGVCVPRYDADRLEQALDVLLGRPAETWDTPERRDWVAGRERAAVADRFYDLLDSLTQRAAPVAKAREVAVVIPFWQREAGILRRAVVSALAQEGVASPLVVVVDDESPVPPEAELGDLLHRRRDDIVILRQKNGGPGAARNTAIAYASQYAEHIAFLDSDDTWAPTHLATAMRALAGRADFYFCDAVSRDGTATVFGSKSFGAAQGRELEDGLFRFEGDLVEQVLDACPIHTSTVVYRAARLPLRFRPELRTAGEDYLFWTEAAMKRLPTVFSTAPNVALGYGVNVYNGTAWGSAARLRNHLDSVRFIRRAERLVRDPAHAPLLRRHRLAYRRGFAESLPAALRRDGPRAVLPLGWRFFAADPAVLAALPAELANKIRRRLAKGSGSPMERSP